MPSDKYLEIMERMLRRLPNDLSKREGSLIWESLGPTSAEFELVYQLLESLENNAYPLTADHDHLLRHAEIYGYAPNPATNAILRAEIIMDENYSVEIGWQFMIDTVFFTVIEHEGGNNYRIQCDTPGVVGNRYYGTLLPAIYYAGFKSAKILEVLIPGTDEEDTESFRQRYARSFDSRAYGGNEADYIENFVLPQDGVGDCKIIRCPRGAGTVDVIIITSVYDAPTEELIANVQEAIEPKNRVTQEEVEASGLGLAPIGHDVIVKGVREKKINIEVKLEYRAGYSWENVKDEYKKLIEDYFLDLAKSWGTKNKYTLVNREYDYKKDFLTVLIGKIESLLFDLTGVVDYERDSTLLNGQKDNIDLEFDEIPVLGELSEITNG